MPPKASSAGATRGRARGNAASSSKSAKKTTSRSKTRDSQSPQDTPSDRSDDEQPRRRQTEEMDIDREERRADASEEDDNDDAEKQKTIPPELLTRICHEFFEKDGTRLSKDANKAVAKYMDIFVREAIARTAVEKGSGFLEVADLEKIAPQLLMDL
ncbi:CENP-S associating centromere protein X-domain-containing protein [Xylaria intraflava]|nr:CENP-S associating centromere protein X-domain-containing protein [Xylaria intraflava]